MAGNTRIFVGDLVRAWKKAGDAAGGNRAAIAAMLGFVQGAGAQPAPATTSTTRQPESDGPGRKVTVEDILQAGQQPAGEIGDLLDFDFTQTEEAAPPVPVVAAAMERAAAAPGAMAPLLHPLWERGVLTEAIGRPQAEGEIDLARAVEALARGAALREVPRKLVQSVSKGCQLLIDRGTGMKPFARDTKQLAGAVRRAAGAAHTRVLTFIDCPAAGVLTEVYEDAPYQAPANGALVLAVTDLCRGGPRTAIREAEPEDWLEVAKAVRDAGGSLVVLNPYPPERWPAVVTGRIPVVYWDRSTRAADVRRTRRRVRR